jgi:hypothetical protein
MYLFQLYPYYLKSMWEYNIFIDWVGGNLCPVKNVKNPKELKYENFQNSRIKLKLHENLENYLWNFQKE